MSATGIGDILSQTYSYDSINNITGITDTLDTAKNRSYDYDNLYRLTDESYVAVQNSFQYDLVGNRTQQTATKEDSTSEVITYSYENDSNRLREKGGETWITNAAGNTSSTNDGARRYTYNHANRLKTYSENDTLKGTYYYNAVGQRVRTDKAEDSLLHYDLGGQYLSETHLSAGGAVQSRVDYIYLDIMPIAQVGTVYNGGQAQTTLTYLHTDHLYTPRVGTSQNETVVWRWDSDAFGQVEPNADPDGDATLVTVNLRFPGQIKGEEVSHYYNYYRDYDAASGRYIQSDPIGLVQ